MHHWNLILKINNPDKTLGEVLIDTLHDNKAFLNVPIKDINLYENSYNIIVGKTNQRLRIHQRFTMYVLKIWENKKK